MNVCFSVGGYHVLRAKIVVVWVKRYHENHTKLLCSCYASVMWYFFSQLNIMPDIIERTPFNKRIIPVHLMFSAKCFTVIA